MKRLTVLLLMLALLSGVLAAPAGADSAPRTFTFEFNEPTANAGVYAVPNQRLSLRTGPNTRYAELFTLPETTSITAYSRANGNGVTWVQVEFIYEGEYYRAYTGLKRMDVRGEIPWESNYNFSCLVNGYHTVYAAPRRDAATLGWVEGGELVTCLGVENGYDYIEFYDDDAQATSRGYIRDADSRVTGSGFIIGSELAATDGDGAYMTENAFVYEKPDGNSRHTGAIVKGLVVGWLGDYGEYVHILYYDSAFGELYDGYVERERVAKND